MDFLNGMKNHRKIIKQSVVWTYRRAAKGNNKRRNTKNKDNGQSKWCSRGLSGVFFLYIDLNGRNRSISQTCFRYRFVVCHSEFCFFFVSHFSGWGMSMVVRLFNFKISCNVLAGAIELLMLVCFSAVMICLVG